MQVAGCVALVSGGASGLGAATAARLADAGARVVVLDLPREGGGTPGTDDTPRVEGDLIEGDVTDERDVQRAVDAATALGSLRIVVTCAGIAPPGRLLGRDGPLDLAAFERVVRVNLAGTVNVIRLAAPALAATDPVGEERGVVVTTSSVAAFDGQIGQVAYAASKAAVAGMTLPLAREFADRLIRVVSVAPGLFETPLLAGLPAAARESLGAQVPHPARLGRPQEFAALVEHIVRNPMLNGETIRLDGAIRMAPR